MPSHYDNTYHWQYAKPAYDDEQDLHKHQLIRESDYALELKTPAPPSREQEIQYLNWFRKDLASDPWFTLHSTKLKCSPKRWPWKNYKEMHDQYKMTFFAHFCLGGAMAWPLGVMVGRLLTNTTSGLPKVPHPRLVPDFINLDPQYHHRKIFRRYMFGTMALGGFLFARATLNQDYYQNKWYNRPDLKPFPAMLDQGDMSETERSMLQAHYRKFQLQQNKQERKRSTWYRLLFPNDGDYSVSYLPQAYLHKSETYSLEDGHYHTYTNDFPDHYQ